MIDKIQISVPSYSCQKGFCMSYYDMTLNKTIDQVALECKLESSCAAFVYKPSTSNGLFCRSRDKGGIFRDFQLCTFDQGTYVFVLYFSEPISFGFSYSEVYLTSSPLFLTQRFYPDDYSQPYHYNNNRYTNVYNTPTNEVLRKHLDQFNMYKKKEKM